MQISIRRKSNAPISVLIAPFIFHHPQASVPPLSTTCPMIALLQSQQPTSNGKKKKHFVTVGTVTKFKKKTCSHDSNKKREKNKKGCLIK